ncbi:hypothetical protein G210_5550 [Candida maltosa Xu316]|uniref:Uncharacterized protein n=1 Tax=Candida maltosa (strain Xu316) TaxID=1245528 RepID=M3JBY6_CANMX|nr:hypothetical protein G210_5550 [Candida maltosa Xu316]
MALTFIDLPFEIRQKILDYVPFFHLKLIKDIPAIKQNVLNTLYKEVFIGRPHTPYSLRDIQDVFYTQLVGFRQTIYLFNNIFEFMSEINTNGIHCAKVIFSNPLDVLSIHKLDPLILKNVNLEIFDFNFEESSLVDHFWRDLFSLNYNIVKLNMHPDIINSISQEVTNLNSISSIDMTDENWPSAGFDCFPNLTELKIRSEVNFEDLELLPQGLLKLEFTMHVSIFPENRLLKLKLPISLTDLNIQLISSFHDPLCVFDIEDLINLKTLTYIDFPNTTSWFLPSKLTKIDADSGSIDLGDAFLSCPDLQTIDYWSASGEWSVEVLNSFRSHYRKNFKRIQVTELPSSIVNLKMPLEDLSKIKFNENNSYGSPPNGPVTKLRSLVLYAVDTEDLTDSDCESLYDSTFNPVLDFQLEKFSSLQYLLLDEPGRLTIKGDLPVTLTALTITSCKEPSFSSLETLINLTHLYINHMTIQSPFDYNLPASLRFMSISHCKFSSINIKAKNLLSIAFSGSMPDHVTNQNLILPPTLIELDLSGNDIKTIDNDFNWPPEMQKLDLESNSLSTLAGLPLTLKHLDLKDNRFWLCDSQQEWPESLEELHLEYNNLDLASLQTLNLSRCRKLKYLDLTYSRIFHLPNLLPELNDLEEIRIINGRKLRLFETSKSTNIFGPSVKYVDIRGNHLTAEDCENIIEELFQKPNFQRLIMTKEYLLDKYQPYVLDRRIIVVP